MLRRALLGLSRSDKIKNLVVRLPVTSGVVARFVAGETVEDVVSATRRLVGAGLAVTIDHLGEDTLDRTQAERVTAAYLELLSRLDESALTRSAEVSLKLSAVGRALSQDGEKIALDNARRICQAADAAKTTVTLDMEDHTTTDSTLAVLSELRADFPDTGAVLQAYLHRTEADCRDLSGAGSRVRLCKGAYKEPESVAFQEPAEVDKSYVRCLKVLMAGRGYPMVATHDPRLIPIAQDLARRNRRMLDSWELQMLYGIRPTEQQRLATQGHTVRVYVPYGTDWYGYLVRRLAERPANLTFFARSLLSKS
ncbi:proline dehydrogenase family protein [Microlunatus panaciterrae]|uniref:proline dehydrogenase n=1 Tax=Microlunatus panaciterrae TaxID=400768 RepID=A0ABS2RHB7_9ACTN|nr:proline dehydrogenase family protein [Microlunatus panaciterrae]MBM7798401.1 proline dehydrogenase [Microlunatus panaciterrae]